MAHKFENILDFGDLADRLRHWTSFVDDAIYDYGGMVQFLTACLDNLRTYAVEGEIEEIREYLTPEQEEFLLKLAHIIQTMPLSEDT